ncbi:MAG: type II toxin-antitoxin system RatA family toxin [Pseudomonadota bacterium]
MRSVSRTALVPYTAARMYALVDDVEAYPEFLPWCSGAEVLERSDAHVVARVDMRRAGLTRSFTTRNSLEPGESISLELVGGPFSHLSGDWTFEPLGDAGSKVTLKLEFDFESRALDALLGLFFEDTLNSMVDAFTRRAAQVYGEG